MKKSALGVALVLVIIVGLAVGACARSSSPEVVQPDRGSSTEGYGANVTLRPAPGANPGKDAVSAGAADQSAPVQSWSDDRLIIRNASLDIQVEDVTAAVERIAQVANQAGGYVVSSKTWGDGKKLAGAISVRVPAEKFDATVKSIRAFAFKVTTEDISTRDVSEEYVDLQSRLRNLEATLQQLLKVLQQATKVDETLAVQREITRVQGDIEQTKGRMQFLERSSATSLINVNLQGSGLTSDFVASANEVKTGDEIKFTDWSTGGTSPYSYEWNFGDGVTSDVKNPAHTYQKASAYTVSLKIRDDKGLTATETKKSFVMVTQAEQWTVGGAFAEAARTLVIVAKGLVTVVAYLLFLSPIWGGALALGLWLSRRGRKTKA